jgi:hypothetical protein
MAPPRIVPIGIAVTLAGSSFVGDAWADSMQCGRRIVATGDSLQAVRSVCGEPTSQRQRVETRTVRRSVEVDCGTPKEPHRRCVRVESVTRAVQIDEWMYDFGPRRFVQYLTFVDGWLETVEAGGRGSGEPHATATGGR